MIRSLGLSEEDKMANFDSVSLLDTTLTIYVGPGGEFPTINDALKYASKYKVGHTLARPYINIQLQSGFVMREQVIVNNINFSHVLITSVDSEVVIDRSYLLTDFNGRYPAFAGQYNSILPYIQCLFNMNTNGVGTNRDGLYIAFNSEVNVNTNCGIKNSGGIGAYIYSNSRALLAHSIFTGSGSYNLLSRRGHIIANDGTFTSASGVGVYAIYGGIISAQGANAQKTPGSNSTTDFYVGSSGIITLDSSSVGGTNVTVNTVSSAGLITKT